jgi:hypothetical protein
MNYGSFKFLQNGTLFVSIFLSVSAQASINSSEVKNTLLQKYMVNYSDKNQIIALKSETIKHGGESVEALIEVMKNGKYPDKNRWVATFLLGQIMGRSQHLFYQSF